MATVTRENIGLLNEKIVVKVAKDDYLPSFEKAIKTYSKQANIPGFRKGMVPVGMVKKMHGSSVFADEVLKSVEKGLTDYMVKEKLEIFAQPLPMEENDVSKLNMSNPAEYAFAFEVGLKPSFTLPDIATAPVTLYKITVPEEMVEEDIKRMQLRNGKTIDAEVVNSDDHILNVTFIACDATGNEVENGLTKSNSLLVKYFTEGFRNELTGKQKDDILIVQLSKVFDEKEKEWVLKDLGLTEKDADNFFKIVINKVELLEKAELNEELFNTTYPSKEIKTEVDFKNAVKEDIQNYFETQSRSQLFDQLYHYLVDHTTIEFPASFLKRWMQNGTEKSKTPEQVDTEYPAFVNSLKWTLIVEQIVKDNNIDVKQEELQAFAKQQLFSYMGNGNSMGMDMDAPWVTSYVDKMMTDKKFIDEAAYRIQTDKVFAWAATKATPTEKAISQEAFTALKEGHNHHH